MWCIFDDIWQCQHAWPAIRISVLPSNEESDILDIFRIVIKVLAPANLELLSKVHLLQFKHKFTRSNNFPDFCLSSLNNTSSMLAILFARHTLILILTICIERFVRQNSNTEDTMLYQFHGVCFLLSSLLTRATSRFCCAKNVLLHSTFLFGLWLYDNYCSVMGLVDLTCPSWPASGEAS